MPTTHSWYVVGASAIGTSHQAHGLPCQDAYHYDFTEMGEVVIAVADGAGSAERSDEGSALAVSNAVRFWLDLIGKKSVGVSDPLAIMKSVFEQTQRLLLHKAMVDKVSARLFATTLTCVVISDDMIVTGQVGDGLVVVECDETLVPVVIPKRGEYANETAFLTQNNAARHFSSNIHMGQCQSVAISTDGLLRLAVKLPDYIPSPGFFQPLFRFARQTTDPQQAQRELEDFLGSERTGQRTDDDKTLVLVVRESGSAPLRHC